MDDSREEYFLEQPVSPFEHPLFLHALTHRLLSPDLSHSGPTVDDPGESM